MLSKCIGIISYFPSDQRRKIRKERFLNLLSVLDTYFKLPIVIIAQNWSKEDFNLEYSNEIKIYNYNNALGITKARAILRDKLLKEDYDYFIFLDDDADLKCTAEGVRNYLEEIDNHPNMICKFNKCWLRLYATSKSMLKKMDFDYLLKVEEGVNKINGGLWDDFCWTYVYESLYHNKVYQFSKIGISDVSLMGKNDIGNSTWCEKITDDSLYEVSSKVRTEWLKVKRNEQVHRHY